MADPNAGMDIPCESVPLELKSSCEQILKRARELRKADPVMSYWCCFSAANSAMTIPSRSSEGTQFLVRILDVLESMKANLIASESIETATITDESAGSAYVESFAIKVFLQADDEDRAGKANKSTIRKFVVAAQFIEVLRTFEAPYGMREEMEQKLQYARWKAADIAKALKEGKKPTPGPPGGEPMGDVVNSEGQADPGMEPFTADSFPASMTSSAMASGSGSGLGGGLGLPARQDSLGSGAWSTAATPGVRDEDEVRDGLSLAGEVHSTDPVTTLPSDGENDLTERETNVDKKNVRFAGPDGVPLSPATTFVSMDSYVAPQGPPPTVFFEPDEATATAATSTFETRTPADGSRDISSLGSGTAQRKTDSPIIRSTPSAPVKPAAAPIAPSAPLPSPELKTPIASLDTKSIERCQKHCKWAISALDYEDLDTARAELRKALAMLEG